jgi:putative IMPACT (imprinted ancient) family translation regulator
MQDEVIALEAIYQSDFTRISENIISVNYTTPLGPLVLIVTYNETYPDTIPRFELFTEWPIPSAGPDVFYDVPSDMRTLITDSFNDIFNSSNGEVFVYQWTESLRDILDNFSFEGFVESPGDTDENPPLTPDSTTPVSAVDYDTQNDITQKTSYPGLYTCKQSITDRRSIFTAHYAPVNSPSDVKQILSLLLLDKKIARATHNISAYRIKNQNGTIIADCDDDGETAAGSRLAHMLHVLGVENVLVVVSRWYGGIQLGPVRFKHINNAARLVLEEVGVVK